MAENVILKTQILLRNDIAANWTAANPVLGQGEVGLETDTKKLKVGDGTTAWNSLDYYNEAAEADLSSVTNTHYEVSSKDELPENNVVKGDIGVVRTVIAHDAQTENPIFSYTAYVWNGNAWAAMDGNYNADNVYFDEDLIMTQQFGKYAPDNTGSVSIPAQGKNLTGLLLDAYSEEKDPEVTYPSVSFTTSSNQSGEVGTEYTLPSATLKVSSIGSYQYGPDDTGIIFEKQMLKLTETTSENNSVSNNMPFTDDDSITLTAIDTDPLIFEDTVNTYTFEATSVQYTTAPNVVPHTNLGNDASNCRIGAIAGSGVIDNETATKFALDIQGTTKSVTFTGFRKMFWGTMTTKPTTMTSADIRALEGLKDSNKDNGIQAAKGERSLTIPVDCYRVVIAVPAARTLSKVLDVNDSNANIVDSFKSMTVNVEGANNYDATSYKVYYLDYANANDKENTYKVTIA